MPLLTMLSTAVFLSTLLLVTTEHDDFINSGYYTAAVYEHARFDGLKYSMPDIIAKNLLAYENVTSVAAEKSVDIIVFPEFGLYPLKQREVSKEYAEYIPDPQEVSWNPCISSTDTPIAKKLSCMAKDHNIYLVANMLSFKPCAFSDPECPSDNVHIYNTNVVFNRNGELVARYHKYDLYFEPGIDIPKKFEYVTFKTEFATIGTFICFDIMWKPSVELLQKYKIDTLVYPTCWIEALPMYSSIQEMSSWAFENKINVLGANGQRPSSGTLGSGIFLGSSRTAHYVYKPNGKSKLIIAKVPVGNSEKTVSFDPATIIEFDNIANEDDANNIDSGKCSKNILGPAKNIFDYRCNDMDLSNFTLAKLKKDRNTASACNNHLCCMVNYDAIDMNEDYYVAVINNTYSLSNYYVIWEEVCMVVRCDQRNGKDCATFPTKSNTVFKQLTIKANMSSKYVYPSVLITGVQLLPSEKWSHTTTTLSLGTDDGLLFAVLNGRAYDNDPPYPREESVQMTIEKIADQLLDDEVF